MPTSQGPEPLHQVLQQLQHTNQLLTQMSDRVLTLENERARRISIATDTVDELRVPAISQGSAASPPNAIGLVDTRSLGKPEIFKGDEGSFADWAFIFKSYVGCIAQEYIPLLERCEQSRSPMVNRGLAPADQRLSNQLYYMMVMLLRGRALDIAHNCGIGEGFETYRRLFEQYHPRVASKYVGSLSLILSTRFSNDIESELEAFDKTIRRYESESGKTLDDEILLGVVVNGLQDSATRDHIIRNSARLTTFQQVRTELLEIARTNRVLSQMPAPMDIGALPKGKGGKGKKGKGDQKGGKGSGKSATKDGKGKETPKTNPNADKECFYCKKKGHVKAECRKKAADDKQKSKGSGKHRTPNAAAPSDEPEPMSATPTQETTFIASAIAGQHEVLVDTGAGMHLFQAGFDQFATKLNSKANTGLVTVTGEPLETGGLKRSVIATEGGDFNIDYAESSKVGFSVMSAGQAALKGTWTIIGPDTQCMIVQQHSGLIQRAVEQSQKIQLLKKRGVHWLPVSGCKVQHAGSPAEPIAAHPAGSTAGQAGSPAGQDVVAAVRAAKKAIPAGEEDAVEEAHGGEGDMAVIDPAQEIVLGDPPPEESEVPRPPKAKKIPDTVSKNDFDSHMLTHVPFRNWCDHCMAGKVREDPHPRRSKGQDPQDVPRVSLDYCFLGRNLEVGDEPDPKIEDLKKPQDEEENNVPVLVVLDEKTGCAFASVVAKGNNAHAVNVVVEALRFTGRLKVILHTDGEPSIRALADAAAKQWNKEAQIQTAPRDSHASNGAVERCILEVSRQVRTVVHALESRYPGFKVKTTSLVYPWAVRHAAWLLTRFLIKSDGKTPYERLRGREYRGEITEFGEVSHFKLADDKKGKLDAQSAVGVWLGKSLNSDEHYLGTENGIRRCRSLWRRPEKLRWSREKLNTIKGVPWQPKGEPTSMLRTDLKGVRGPRSVYITLDRQIKYGQTPGCPGCHSSLDDAKRHSEECRKRFEGLVKQDAKAPEEKRSITDAEMGQVDTEPGLAQLESGEVQPSSSSVGSTAGQAGSPAGHLGPAGSTASQAGGSAGGPDPAGNPADPRQEKKRAFKPASEPKTGKKVKDNPKQGEKRAAEVPTEDIEQMTLHEFAQLGATPEIMCGLPTLHYSPMADQCAWTPVASYPEWGRVTEAFDERTGAPLPLEKVKRARGRELEKMKEHQVKTDISWEAPRERKLKIVRSRWVDGWKPLPDDPNGVRSRCVAQEINTGPRDDVHSGTPPLKGHRMVLSSAATTRKGQPHGHKLVARYDVSVAFFHAMSTGSIAVIPPEDVNEGSLWYLLKAMNGTREASKQWSTFVEDKVTNAGFTPVKVVPGLFFHAEWQVTLSCHGDDFLAEGMSADLDKLDELMAASFETKTLPRIGPPENGGQATEGSHLHRIIRWTGKGFSWQADPKYSEILVAELGLKGSKGVDTPSSKDTGKGDRTAGDELPAEEAAEFRRLAGTALHLSLDRPSIQFAMSEISSGMAKPTRLHMMRLRRLGRYLVKFPTEVWNFDYQEAPSEVIVYTDSDWGADKETRKSMSALAERFGCHLIDSSCARQSVVALSSGEAEFYSLTRGGAAGIMSQQIWDGLGYGRLNLVLETDSSAAKGIASRSGVGKVKHLDLKELWLQDHVRSGKIRIRKVSTDSNWADLGTKSLSGQRVGDLLRIMPLCRRGLVVACLVSCMAGAKAQQDHEEQWWPFMLHMLFVHILAVIAVIQGMMPLCSRRRSTAIQQVNVTRSIGVQTDDCHGGGAEKSSSSVASASLLRMRNQTPTSEDQVYLIGNGVKYHRRTCGIVQASIQRGGQVRAVSLNNAILARYTACGQCGG